MEFLMNPDRERMNLTLIMALLVNGRTVLEDFAWASGSERYAEALKEFGLSYELQGHQLVLDGKGFQYPVPTMLPIEFNEADNVLLWTLASKDEEQLYTFANEVDDAGIARVNAAKELLQKYFKIKVQQDEPAKFVFNFLRDELNVKKDSLGNVSYAMRNRLLLRALIRNEYLNFEEKSTVHDQWTKMLIYFGAAVKYEGRGIARPAGGGSGGVPGGGRLPGDLRFRRAEGSGGGDRADQPLRRPQPELRHAELRGRAGHELHPPGTRPGQAGLDQQRI